MKKFIKFCLLLSIPLLILSCNDDDSSTTTRDEGTARVAVRLTDAPGDYDHVFIDVVGVEVKYQDNDGDEDTENTVILTNVNAGVYDLLELTGGVSVLLGDQEVPAGTISQMRLILGDENSVVVDGETFALSTPSAQQSGLKLQLDETLTDGVFYEFILDFDVDKSIVLQGNGNYQLKPVIRAAVAAESGAISGNVLPLGVQVQVVATDGLIEITSYTDGDGNFVLSGVPEGVYTLTITAEVAAGLEAAVLENVAVQTDAVTDVGVIVLTE